MHLALSIVLAACIHYAAAAPLPHAYRVQHMCDNGEIVSVTRGTLGGWGVKGSVAEEEEDGDGRGERDRQIETERDC